LLDIFVLTAFIAHVSFQISVVTITCNFLLYRYFALIRQSAEFKYLSSRDHYWLILPHTMGYILQLNKLPD